MAKDTRILFDQDYYLLQAVLNSKKFKSMFDKFVLEMNSKGLTFPLKGFKTAKDYHDWRAKAYAKNEYGSFVGDVIKKFSVNNNREKFKLGLEWFIYFGKKKAPIKPTQGKQISISNDMQVVEVSLTIYPWTIKEDVMDDLWKKIEIEQKKLGNYKSGNRNRESIVFEREFKIYELYLILKKNKTKSIYKTLIESNEFKQILENYDHGESIYDSIGPLVTKYNRLLGSIDLV